MHGAYGRTWAALLAGCIAIWTAVSPAAADLSVVVTIKPLHALVSQVMAGAGTPELLVKGSASPHTYALKPSDASRLSQADVFFRMSEAMEPFTVKVAKSLPKHVQVVTLQNARGLKLYPRRTSATFDDDHDHADGSDHDHGHGQALTDSHAWLDPINAKAMVDRIAQVLSEKEPSRAALFNANAAALKTKLDALSAELARDLTPVAGRPYVVFHDALQYFERRYKLRVAGSVSVSPEVPPSAKRLSELRKKIASLGAVCVFAEPQFDTRLVDNLVEGTRARTGTIDPEGSRIEPGLDLYFTLLRNLAQDLKGCLSPPA
ncbi:MAG: zinc ABC transporter substrate-binding protein [Hyphomonadaceae bacterium]|jgi:zinc transport system substrate-binding protein|nr:zinc ABC transporter substrate-binding protein [Hyphomonadaceae bacterium]